MVALWLRALPGDTVFILNLGGSGRPTLSRSGRSGRGERRSCSARGRGVELSPALDEETSISAGVFACTAAIAVKLAELIGEVVLGGWSVSANASIAGPAILRLITCRWEDEPASTG